MNLCFVAVITWDIPKCKQEKAEPRLLVAEEEEGK
jgi:hypothetical protein